MVAVRLHPYLIQLLMRLYQTKVKPNLLKRMLVDGLMNRKAKKKEILSNILNLYKSDNDRLPILNNGLLNEELEALAALLITTIVEANKSVEVQVKQVFEVFGCL